MDAMIFAAGLGRRLAPLTYRLPKALVPVGGRPLLAHVLDRVVAAGATRVVVNTCRFGEAIAAWARAHTPSGVELVLSPEPDGPYDTGGGLVAAAHLFTGEGAILLHAVDVLSRIPLERLVADHRAARARTGPQLLATLAVQDRRASRKLLFDGVGLAGWQRLGRDGEVEEERRVRADAGPARALGFAGIHVIERELLVQADRTGTFPIRDLYLECAGKGRVVRPFDATRYAWLDVGTAERLAEAERRGW